MYTISSSSWGFPSMINKTTIKLTIWPCTVSKNVWQSSIIMRRCSAADVLAYTSCFPDVNINGKYPENMSHHQDFTILFHNLSKYLQCFFFLNLLYYAANSQSWSRYTPPITDTTQVTIAKWQWNATRVRLKCAQFFVSYSFGLLMLTLKWLLSNCVKYQKSGLKKRRQASCLTDSALQRKKEEKKTTKWTHQIWHICLCSLP